MAHQDTGNSQRILSGCTPIGFETFMLEEFVFWSLGSMPKLWILGSEDAPLNL